MLGAPQERGMGGRATAGLRMADPRDRAQRFFSAARWEPPPAQPTEAPHPPTHPTPAECSRDGWGTRFISDSLDGFHQNRRLPLPSTPKRMRTRVLIIKIRKNKGFPRARAPGHLPCALGSFSRWLAGRLPLAATGC